MGKTVKWLIREIMFLCLKQISVLSVLQRGADIELCTSRLVLQLERKDWLTVEVF